MNDPTLRAYLIDDEPLATERLRRLLEKFSEVSVLGACNDPGEAIEFLRQNPVDLLFLDIQMPGINGFELLARLPVQPLVIFTTAYDEYALRAFEVNSIDYLLKPIDEEQLERAIKKIGRLRSVEQNPAIHDLLKKLAASLGGVEAGYPRRIASRVGERISFLDLNDVTHFVAQDKLTFAVAGGSRHAVDQTIVELERRLDPARFLRVHRSVLVNVDWIQEVNSWFVGKVMLLLKDAQRTQLPVARDRVKDLKSRLGI
jgi:two-component system LytT family response regulator